MLVYIQHTVNPPYSQRGAVCPKAAVPYLGFHRPSFCLENTLPFPVYLSYSHRHPFTFTLSHVHTHSSNYGNQQADPISVSCLLCPRGWLPDHLTLHNLICNDRVWHPDFWPYQLLVCVYVFFHMRMCEILTGCGGYDSHPPNCSQAEEASERAAISGSTGEVPRIWRGYWNLPLFSWDFLPCLSCLKSEGPFSSCAGIKQTMQHT